LTENDFVLLSAVAFNAFGEFLGSSMPRFQIGAPEVRMLCGNVVRTYFRKRKKFGTDAMPMAKKRAVLSYTNGKNVKISVSLSLSLLPLSVQSLMELINCRK